MTTLGGIAGGLCGSPSGKSEHDSNFRSGVGGFCGASASLRKKTERLWSGLLSSCVYCCVCVCVVMCVCVVVVVDEVVGCGC